MLGDIVLAPLEVVPQQQIEYLAGFFGVLGHHPDQSPGLRVHGGLPHHFRFVFTQPLGTLDGAFSLQFFDDVVPLLVGIGKIGLGGLFASLAPFGIDLIQRSLGDIDISLLNELRGETIEHGEHQSTDLESVHIAIGADDHLIPPEHIQVKRRKLLVAGLDLHPAAQHFDQVGDDVAFEDLIVIGLEAIQDLAPDGHDGLKFRVTPLLAGTQGGVALHDIDLPLVQVLAAAVHKLLHPVGHIHGAGQLLFDVQPGLFRLLPAALVHQHLIGDLVGLLAVFDEIDLQGGPKELGHHLLDEFVGNGLFGLVFIGGVGGKAIGHQNQAVGNVGKRNLAFIFLVFSRLLQIGIQSRDKGRAGRLVRRAAVLQPGGVVVILQQSSHIGKTEGCLDLYLVFRLVRPVSSPALGLIELHRGQGIVPGQLLYIVHNAVFVVKVLFLKLALLHLLTEVKTQSLIDHGLLFQHLLKIFSGDAGVGEHIQVQFETVGGTRLFWGTGLFQQFVRPFGHILSPAEMEGILPAIPAGDHIHIFRRILGGAGAQTVEAQGIFVILPFGVAVFSAGIELAVDQLPVITAFPLVVIHRHAPPEVLHLDGPVQKMGHIDHMAKPFPGFVDGIGEDLKKGVLAALDPIGAENDPGPLAHPVGSFQSRDALVAIFLLLLSCHIPSEKSPSLQGIP